MSRAAAFAHGQGIPLGTALAAFAYGDWPHFTEP